LAKSRKVLALDSLGFYKPTEPDRLLSKGELFLIADGMGGQDLGVKAARLATEVIIEAYFESTEDIEAAIRHAFDFANLKVLDLNQKRAGYVNAGVSVTVAIIKRGTLHVAHIGNSRIYLVKGNKIKQLNTDHIFKKDPEASPDLRTPPPKNIVAMALGWNTNIKIEYFTLNLKPYDNLLLCTDGLYNALDNRTIGSTVNRYSPQDACDQFMQMANKRGGQDNITTILIKIAGLIAVSEIKRNVETGINLMPGKTSKSTKTTVRFDVGSTSKRTVVSAKNY